MKNNYILLHNLILILMITGGCNYFSAKKTSYTDKGKCYYLSPSGDDQNPGSKSKPWKSLEKINSSDLNPGDTILFEGGSIFSGTLLLDSLDSGEAGKKVVIGSLAIEGLSLRVLYLRALS